MNPYITEMEAIPVSKPHMVAVFNPVTLSTSATKLRCNTKKEPQVKTILCSRLDTVEMLAYL